MAGPELVARRFHLDGDVIVHGGRHLAGQKTAPNELVEPVLLAGQVLFHVLRRQVYVGGADGLVGVLGAALRLVVPGLGRVVLLAVTGLDKSLGRRQGLLGQAQGVGTHIGDEAHGAFPGDVHPFVELLGDRHGTPRGHIQLPGRLLLERRGDKGGRGIAGLVLALHRSDGEGGVLHCLDHLLYLFGAAQLRLFPLAVIVGLEAAQIRGDPRQVGGDGPVLLGLEGADLLLPLHHQPGGHRLDPSGGQAPADLLPQQRGELVAHDAVQYPPSLLGIHQVLVDLPGVGDGISHHLAGDLIEGDSAGLILRHVQHRL